LQPHYNVAAGLGRGVEANENINNPVFLHSLIASLQLPLKLATVCRNLTINSSSSTGSSSSSSASSSSRCEVVAAMYAWKVLGLFLSEAVLDLFRTERSLMSLDKANTSLPCAIAAQLQQSGLLQQIPTILRAAAQLLQAGAAAAAAAGAGAPGLATTEPGSAQEQTAAAAATARTNSSSSSSRAGVCQGAISDTDLLLLSVELAETVTTLAPFKIAVDSSTEAATLDAAAGFCVSFMQFVTAAVDRLAAGAHLDVQYHRPIKVVVLASAHIVEKAEPNPDFLHGERLHCADSHHLLTYAAAKYEQQQQQQQQQK